MSSPNCCFLTCIQISQEADQVFWYSHLFQNFPHWAPVYIPFPRWPQPYTLWGQQVTSTANGGAEWALTSQSLILTRLGKDGEQLRGRWPLPIVLTTPSSFLEFWATFKISYFTCSLSRSLKGKIYITFFVVNLLHGWIDNKHGIRKWQLINIWKIADEWFIYLIYAESNAKIRREDEQRNRRQFWSKQEYNEIQITQKKKRKITKNQEEMSNLLGNIRNANKNNNGMWFLSMQIANCQSSMRKLIYTKFSLQMEDDRLEKECFSSVVKA